MGPRLNIAHVARAAGVSTTTVSRVLNRVPTVSDDNRRRVETAIRKLGFRPNISAQRLAAGKTMTVGLIIPRFEGIFRSFYALEVLKGMGQASEQLRLDMLLHITDGSSLPNPTAIGGLVFVDVDGNEELLDRAVQEELPVVVLNHYLEDLPVSCVAVDNKAAARQVVDYLVELGHREVAIITGDLEIQAGLDRLDGFVSALRAKRLPIKDAYLQRGDFSVASARQRAETLLGLKDRPTAIFAASDEMAMQTIDVVIEHGLRVPEDVSVVGFDDSPLASHGRIGLTTIRQPLNEMGQRAIEILHSHMTGKRKSPLKLFLPTELVERQSCRQTSLVI